LGQEQSEPSEAVVLRLQILLLQPVENWRVVNFKLSTESGHESLDATFGIIQRLDEKISDFTHQISKAKKAVGLGKLCKR